VTGFESQPSKEGSCPCDWSPWHFRGWRGQGRFKNVSACHAQVSWRLPACPTACARAAGLMIDRNRPRLLASLPRCPRDVAGGTGEPGPDVTPNRSEDGGVLVGFVGTEELSDALARTLGPA
jgi:hypothetical protein